MNHTPSVDIHTPTVPKNWPHHSFAVYDTETNTTHELHHGQVNAVPGIVYRVGVCSKRCSLATVYVPTIPGSPSEPALNPSVFVSQAGFFRFAAYNINDSESWHNYAACRQLAYGDYDGASECYMKAIEINPNDPSLQVGGRFLEFTRTEHWLNRPGRLFRTQPCWLERLIHCYKDHILSARRRDTDYRIRPSNQQAYQTAQERRNCYPATYNARPIPKLAVTKPVSDPPPSRPSPCRFVAVAFL